MDDLETRRRPPLSVFEQFRAFWREVDALRTVALSPSMAPSASPGTAAPGTMVVVHAPSAVRERLLAALRSQEAELSRAITGKALNYYREAQYTMVAVADEVFVRLPWNGASYWASNLLETERFATRRAGQAVFERIDSLLERADPDDKELAALYLTALALGFQGKYADRFDGGALERYRQSLYHFIFEKHPDLTHPFRRIVPQCYEGTIAAGAGQKLRSPRLWWWAAAGVMALWLLFSQLVWMSATGPLRGRMDAILLKTRQLEEPK